MAIIGSQQHERTHCPHDAKVRVSTSIPSLQLMDNWYFLLQFSKDFMVSSSTNTSFTRMWSPSGKPVVTGIAPLPSLYLRYIFNISYRLQYSRRSSSYFQRLVLDLSRCCRSWHGSYPHIVFVLVRLNGNHMLLRLLFLFANTIEASCKGTHRSSRVSKHGRIEVGSNRRVWPYRGQKQEVVALCPPMVNQGLRGARYNTSPLKPRANRHVEYHNHFNEMWVSPRNENWPNKSVCRCQFSLLPPTRNTQESIAIGNIFWHTLQVWKIYHRKI